MENLNYNYNDGGRAKYFKGKTGDCVTRAIAIASDMDYLEVYNSLMAETKDFRARKNTKTSRRIKSNSVRNGVFKDIYKPWLEKNGWTWVPCQSFGQKSRVKINELDKSRMIVSLPRHLTTIIDGVLHDTFDCRYSTNWDTGMEQIRSVVGYFYKKQGGNKGGLGSPIILNYG